MRYIIKTIKQKLIVVIVLITSLLGSCQQTPQYTKTNSIHQKIDTLVNTFAFNEGFNGALLIAHKGEIVYKKGIGLANREWKIPNTTHTKFQIASLTKSFTAVLVMQLVAENKLSLTKPITHYLPNLITQDNHKITIHQLLTHSSGIARSATINVNKNEAYPALPLQFTPGTDFLYSNAGYTLLGHIIEKVSNKTFAELLKENICTPLNMHNTGYFKPQDVISEMSAGYYKSWGQYFNANKDAKAYTAGGIYSTVEDIYTFNNALATGQLLPKKITNLIFKKHIADPAYNGHYGYGQELITKSIGNTTATTETIGHSGSISGYCALFTRIPASNTSIILLSNTQRAYLNTITKAVMGILLDKPYDFPKKSLVKTMQNVIDTHNVSTAITFFKQQQNNNTYYVDEQELIVTGYEQLHAGNIQDAANLFKLSIAMFPEKDNPYDSYAEALMLLGKPKEAITNYKKSLAINPKNHNAVQMLKKLEQTN